MKCSLPLLVLLVVNSNSYFSSCQSVRGVFFFPYISQYVGVIFNHNITPSSSLNTHVFLFVQTICLSIVNCSSHRINFTCCFSSDHFFIFLFASNFCIPHKISFLPFKLQSPFWSDLPLVPCLIIVHYQFLCQFCFDIRRALVLFSWAIYSFIFPIYS